MKTKNAHKLDPKKINKIFIWITFACVFIFTLALGMCNFQFKNNAEARKLCTMWSLIGLAIAAVIVAAIWVTLYLVAKKQNETENDKKIKQVLKDKKKDDSKK